MFLHDLTEHATQREFVYSHPWRPHDLVMWDNRATMHRARRFDRNEVRDVRRTTLAGDAPTVEQVRRPFPQGTRPRAWFSRARARVAASRLARLAASAS